MSTEKETNAILFDCETGGLFESQHCLLQVGAIIFRVTEENNLYKIIELAQYESKVKPYPNLGITLKALSLNGLKVHDLVNNGKEEKTVYREIMELMEQYMGKEHNYNSRIWAHNDNFDAKFMTQLAKRCQSKEEKNVFYDTNWNCTQHQFRYLRFLGLHKEDSCKLCNIMDYYGLENEGKSHDALNDAHNSVRVLECIMNHQRLGHKLNK